MKKLIVILCCVTLLVACSTKEDVGNDPLDQETSVIENTHQDFRSPEGEYHEFLILKTKYDQSDETVQLYIGIRNMYPNKVLEIKSTLAIKLVNSDGEVVYEGDVELYEDISLDYSTMHTSMFEVTGEVAKRIGETKDLVFSEDNLKTITWKIIEE